MSEDRKQLQVVLPRANGVSSALWPASARRCIATSKEAQRHRYMIINGKKWMFFPLLLVVSATMGMSAALVAALSWHLWYLLPVAALLLLVLLNAGAGINARSISLHLRVKKQSSRVRYRRSARKGAIGTTGSKIARRVKHAQVQATPRTPMPELPLVRVLETFDLSQSTSEHVAVGQNREGDQQRQDSAELLLNLAETKNAR